jgi:hypothetical protein
MKLAFPLLYLNRNNGSCIETKNLKGGVAEADLVTKLSGTGKASPSGFIMVDGF